MSEDGGGVKGREVGLRGVKGSMSEGAVEKVEKVEGG